MQMKSEHCLNSANLNQTKSVSAASHAGADRHTVGPSSTLLRSVDASDDSTVYSLPTDKRCSHGSRTLDRLSTSKYFEPHRKLLQDFSDLYYISGCAKFG